LGADFHIIEEGLSGRTTAFDDSSSISRSGLKYLPVALETHYPLTLLIIMLGTNDLKAKFGLGLVDISHGVEQLLQVAKAFRPEIDHVLLVSPPHIVTTDNPDNREQFPDGVERSKALSQEYRSLAERHECDFFDAAIVAHSSPIDGIHLDASNHRKLGEGIAEQSLLLLNAKE
jgi:lysophospholipase L1-like esterase